MQTLESIHIKGVTPCSLCKVNGEVSYLVSHHYTVRNWDRTQEQLEPIDFHHQDSNHQNHAINACIKSLCESYGTTRDQVVLTGVLRYEEPAPVVEASVEGVTSVDTNSYTLKFYIGGNVVVSTPTPNAFDALHDAVALYEDHSIDEVEVTENGYKVVATVRYGVVELEGF